jgi:hypothetical protein
MLILFCIVLHIYTGTLTPPEREATFLDKSVHRFSNFDVAYFLSLRGNRKSEITSLSRVVTHESVLLINQ